MQPSAPTNKYSIKYYPDQIKDWKREGNFFCFYATDTILEVKVITDKIVRFRYAPENRFQRDFSYAVNPSLKEAIVELDVREEETYFEIITARINVQIAKDDLRVTIKDKAGNIINEDEVGFHWQYYLLKGGKIVFCSKKIQPGENFYGLGDKPTEFNLRSKRLENYGTDNYGYRKDTDPLYKNIPFYYGLHNNTSYGIFFDNTFRTIFDFGKEENDTCSFWARGGEMNYYFIYGPEMLQVAEEFTRLTGKPELPPLWSLGYHQCRWSYYPDERVKEVAKTFRKKQIPCDAIYLDIDYMEGFRCFTFSEEFFPDPAKMIRELAEQGFKVVVIIDPGIKVDADYWVYKDGINKGLFCKRADGALMEGDVWPGKCVFPDFTKEEVREWWSSLFKRLVDLGVRGVWNDMNEPAVFEIGTFPEDVRHDYDGEPCSHRKAHNIYGHMMSKATADGITRYLMPLRPFNITRSAYAGAQRWTTTWTGDNTASWEQLWLASIQCQRLAISGISFCGSDIGGFIGEPDGELYIRWLQLATFHPLMRTHSASNETNFNQEPWSFGQKYEFIARRFIRLRYHLLPYLYTTFWQYASQGTPMLRPLVFVAQDDPEALHRSHEFMLGDHLLISHVSEAGMRRKEVYLPKGNWYYFWEDKKYAGQQSYVFDTPLDRIPLFVKAGAVIPNYPQMEFVGEKEIDEMILHVFYKNGVERSILYEDEGEHYGYRNEEFNISRFKNTGAAKQLQLKKKFIGKYKTSYQKHRLIIHGLPFTPTTYTVNGKSYKLGKRNFTLGLVRISVDKAFEEVIIR